jgi:ribulose-5-phosphate 4-epimerase/fuculose-1-phosphate aldolase
MDEFLRLCRAFGQLDELAQAGGGNISVKLDDTYSLIKASGVSLAEVTREKGHCIVNHARIHEAMSMGIEASLEESTVTSGKPSLEVYFHSFMKRYTVHIHPTVLLPYLCGPCPEGISYAKPGFELSEEVYKQWKGESVVYLKNHGVIFTCDTLDTLLGIAHETYERFRTPKYVSLDMYWNLQYEYPDYFIYKVSIAETRVYLPILKQHNIRKLTPDIALFLYDSVFIEGNFIFIRAPTKQACLGILEVLRSYCEVVEQCKHTLTEMEVAAILHWPAEKYRKTISQGT